MRTKQHVILGVIAFLLSLTIWAQPKLTTRIDSTRIKVGSQATLSLMVKVDTLTRVVFPESKMFGSLEVLESYPIDTVKENAQYQLIKKYGLTQWDSGSYVLPKLTVLFNNRPKFTDSLRIEVSNIVVDTLKQKMYDIKPVIEAKAPIGNWWKYVIGLVALALLAFGLYIVYKKYGKKEKSEEIVYKTPFEKATVLLQQLEQKKLVEKDEIKTYYSELTDITRTYIEEVIEIPAMESTSTELIGLLRNTIVAKNMKIKQEVYDNFKRVLTKADLVKFAKSKPSSLESIEDKKVIENVIQSIEVAVPKVEEILIDENEEIIKQKKQAKQLKHKKIIYGSGIVLGLIVVVLSVWIAVKGFTYVKDTVLGHPSKELLEGTWITSAYGNPQVQIQTPEVLKRVNPAKVLPKEAFAMLKEMQLFQYGALLENFHISVATSTYPNDTKIDLSKALEGTVQVWERMGLQNILIKEETFKTPKGIEGIKAFGSMSGKGAVSGEMEKYNFELFYFGQQGGLQQVLVVYKDDDSYAIQMRDRIMNSVELSTSVQ